MLLLLLRPLSVNLTALVLCGIIVYTGSIVQHPEDSCPIGPSVIHLAMVMSALLLTYFKL